MCVDISRVCKNKLFVHENILKVNAQILICIKLTNRGLNKKKCLLTCILI